MSRPRSLKIQSGGTAKEEIQNRTCCHISTRNLRSRSRRTKVLNFKKFRRRQMCLLLRSKVWKVLGSVGRLWNNVNEGTKVLTYLVRSNRKVRKVSLVVKARKMKRKRKMYAKRSSFWRTKAVWNRMNMTELRKISMLANYVPYPVENLTVD